ncbi:hypothetical protein L907_17370 [Agrobacterium sp. C13]|nr:hypothetical protein L904_17455 [Agrobacterium sp. LY4]KVK67888.1 hypothetical protein L907_17370 [Agrobacterium sp. C13]
MFRNRKSEGAAAKIRAVGLFVELLEDQPDLLFRSHVRIQHFLKRINHALMTRFQIGRNEVILRREMPVERRLRNIRFFDDPIYADSPDALAIEERAGGGEDMV